MGRHGHLVPIVGIDIAPRYRSRSGEPQDTVRAIDTGVVVYASNNPRASNYGKYVVVEHFWSGSPFYSLYAHLNRIDVKPGDRVGRGGQAGDREHGQVHPGSSFGDFGTIKTELEMTEYDHVPHARAEIGPADLRFEPAEATDSGTQKGVVVKLASWSDANHTSLSPHRPEATDIVVTFGTEH